MTGCIFPSGKSDTILKDIDLDLTQEQDKKLQEYLASSDLFLHVTETPSSRKEEEEAIRFDGGNSLLKVTFTYLDYKQRVARRKPT